MGVFLQEIEEIINGNTLLHYEQAFLYFLRLFKNNFYFPTVVHKEDKGISVPIYRSRLVEGNSVTTDFSEIKHRPASEVCNFGRINRPSQTYFYACDSPENCLTELAVQIKLKKERNEEFVIITGQWTLKRDLTVCVIPDWNNPRMLPFIQKVESYKHISEENRIVLRFINELFLREDDNSNIYKITAAFCNAILFDSINQKINFDGFLYTSVKEKTGYNVALFPHLVDNGDIVLTGAVKDYIEPRL